jgi:hypothetical protein
MISSSFTLLLLAAASSSLVAAQTPFWSIDLSDRNVLDVWAEVYVHVEISDVYYSA